MAGNLGRLDIELNLNQVKFQTALSKAQRNASRFSERTTQYLKNIEKAAISADKSLAFTNLLAKTNFFGGGLQSALSSIGKYADSYTEIGNRMRLVESESMNAARGIQSVFDISLRANQDIQATSQVYQRFAQNAESLGVSQSQVASLTETVSKAVAISGASAASAQAALMQFGQSLASGIFRGQEFNSVMEQTPGLAQAIARGLGVSIGELRKMANEGKLTMDVIVPALEKAKASVDKLFNTRVLTLSASFGNLTTATTKWIGELNEGLGATSAVASAVNGLANNFGVLASAFGAAGLALAGIKLGQFAKDARATQVKANAAVAAAKAKLQEASAEAEFARVAQRSLSEQLKLAQTEQQRIAIRNQMLIQSQQIIAKTNAETAAAQRLAAARKSANLFSSALGFVGGPLGAVSIALISGVAAYQSYTASMEESRQKALDFANDLPQLRAEIEKMDGVTLEAAGAQARQSIAEQKKELQKLQREYDALAKKISDMPKIQILEDDEGYQITIDNTARLSRMTDELAIKKKDLDAAQKKLNETQQTESDIVSKLADITQNELAKGYEMLGLKLFGVDNDVQKFNSSMLIAANTAENSQPSYMALYNRLTDLGSAARNASSDFMILASNIQLSDKAQKVIDRNKRQQEISKEKDPAKKAKLRGEDAAISAGFDIKTAEGLMVAQSYEAAYNASEMAKSDKKGKKGGENARKNWLDFYDELRQKSTSSLGEIGLEEARMLSRLNEHMKKGVVSHTEYETAKLAISQRFAKQRADLAAQYAPELGFKDKLQEDLALIKQLQEANEINPLQAKRAADAAKLNYAQGISQNAVDPLAKIKGMYDPQQDLLNQQTQELAQLQAFYDQKLISEEDFQQRKKEIIDKYKNDQFQKDMENYSSGLNDLGSAFGNLASVAEQSAGKQSSAYKAMFAVSKSFAIAESTVKLSQAIMQAMSAPQSLTPAEKFANMAAVASAGINVISQISSVGFSGGGYTGDGGKYTPAGIVHRGEYVITKEATNRLGRGYLDYLNYGKRGFANGGGVGVPTVPTGYGKNLSSGNNISVKVINNGEPMDASVSSQKNGDQLEITVELLKQMDKIADQRYRQNQIKDMRSGGALNR